MGCNFCGKVGSQSITNARTDFSILPVKKKEKKKKKENPQNDDQQVYKI
jgi:hypothetical protein